MSEALGYLFAVVAGLAIGFIAAAKMASGIINEQQSKAVELGAAHWQIDQKTGDTTFKWKDPTPAPTNK